MLGTTVRLKHGSLSLSGIRKHDKTYKHVKHLFHFKCAFMYAPLPVL